MGVLVFLGPRRESAGIRSKQSCTLLRCLNFEVNGIDAWRLPGLRQWCRDTYDPDFYCTPQARLPDAWNDGAGIRRSERGGSWVGGAHMARSSDLDAVWGESCRAQVAKRSVLGRPGMHGPSCWNEDPFF